VPDALLWLQVKAAHGVQDELMGAFSKEESRDELEKDPEMCAQRLHAASLWRACKPCTDRHDEIIHVCTPAGRST
jgi:hypothetical protein